MTIDEAKRNIGAGVVYSPEHGQREDGVITSVSDRLVFVRYRGDSGSKATHPGDLKLLARDEVPHE